MIFDRRKKPSQNRPELKPVELPLDYLKIVEETLNENLASGLKLLREIHPVTRLKASGALFTDEVLLAITLSHGENQLLATTVYASADYNPQLPEPKMETILEECLDSVGSILNHYLHPSHPERVAQLGGSTIGTLEEAPFEWTKMEDTRVTVFVKMDKTNPALETLTEDWLMKNDPEYRKNDDSGSEEFLQERLQAIQKAKSGSGGNSGPVRH